jgi:hypothetical protein
MEEVCKKASYSTEYFALEHIALIAKKSTRPLNPKNAYFCKKCNTWHITKQENVEKLKEELNEVKKLLKSREDELFKVKVSLKNFEDSRNSHLGSNEFQIKVRVLEKELIGVKAKSAKNGNKFNEISVKLNSVRNIVNKATKNKYTVEEVIKRLKEKL